MTAENASVDGSGVIAGTTGNAEGVGTAEAQAAYKEVHTQFSATKTSVDVTAGSQYQVVVPPGATVIGIYGVTMRITNGKMTQSNCKDLKDDAAETLLFPEDHTWCVWTRGPDVFEDGGTGPCKVVNNEAAK